jgi:hypothetical protein
MWGWGGGPFPGHKAWWRHDADHSPPSSAEVGWKFECDWSRVKFAGLRQWQWMAVCWHTFVDGDEEEEEDPVTFQMRGCYCIRNGGQFDKIIGHIPVWRILEGGGLCDMTRWLATLLVSRILVVMKPSWILYVSSACFREYAICIFMRQQNLQHLLYWCTSY